MHSISRKDERFIGRSLREASKSSCGQPLGAVLVSGGSIYTGHNARKNRSVISDQPYAHSIHAEMSVLRRAGGKAHGATIYVARAKKSGGFGNAMPCARCLTQMIQAGVSRVVYTGVNEILEIRLSRIEIDPIIELGRQVSISERGYYVNNYVTPTELTAV